MKLRITQKGPEFRIEKKTFLLGWKPLPGHRYDSLSEAKDHMRRLMEIDSKPEIIHTLDGSAQEVQPLLKRIAGKLTPDSKQSDEFVSNETFRPGDIVRFKGFKEGPIKANPVQGELYLADKNTTVKGVMQIKGDIQRMMFLPNGTIYCHPRFGVMIETVKPEDYEIKGVTK